VSWLFCCAFSAAWPCVADLYQHLDVLYFLISLL